MTGEDYLGELATLTKMTVEEWRDFLSCTPDQQALIAQGYRDQDWTAPGSSTFERVLEILGVIGSVAGVLGGVAGAAGAVRALTQG